MFHPEDICNVFIAPTAAAGTVATHTAPAWGNSTPVTSGGHLQLGGGTIPYHTVPSSHLLRSTYDKLLVAGFKREICGEHSRAVAYGAQLETTVQSLCSLSSLALEQFPTSLTGSSPTTSGLSPVGPDLLHPTHTRTSGAPMPTARPPFADIFARDDGDVEDHGHSPIRLQSPSSYRSYASTALPKEEQQHIQASVENARNFDHNVGFLAGGRARFPLISRAISKLYKIETPHSLVGFSGLVVAEAARAYQYQLAGLHILYTSATKSMSEAGAPGRTAADALGVMFDSRASKLILKGSVRLPASSMDVHLGVLPLLPLALHL